MIDQIIQYIPQREPFVMVGEVVSADEKTVRTKFPIKEDNVLLDDGYLAAAGLVENMAQTAAAGMGYMGKEKGEAPKVGYIGALKNLYVYELPKAGDELETEITFQHQVMNASIVHGKVFVNKKEIAGCELKIFINAHT
jgi:predicted hotdog family 3-hydroxylacyl-ACP dehydratase